MAGKAACKLCYSDVGTKNGTGGMSTQLLAKHKKAYVISGGECENKAAKTNRVSEKGQRALEEYVEVLEKQKSLAERKKLFQEAMTA